MKKQIFPKTIHASVRYWLFQIPEFVVVILACMVLVSWQWISKHTAYYVVLAWLIKDLILYPLTVRAYRVDPPQTGTQRMVGLTTILKQPLQSEGIIFIRGERWKATSVSGDPIAAGTKIRVVDTEQFTLVVEPVVSSQPKSRRDGSVRG